MPQAGEGTALVVIDLLDTFRHEGGEALLASARERGEAIVGAVLAARRAGVPIVYVNDNRGRWDGDAPALVREAIDDGLGGDLVRRIAPAPGDRFVLKPGDSAFDHTPFAPLLRSLGVGRVALMGAATEMCVRDTAIDATRRGLGTAVLRDACITTDPELEALALAAIAHLVRAEVVEGLGAALEAGRADGAVR